MSKAAVSSALSARAGKPQSHGALPLIPFLAPMQAEPEALALTMEAHDVHSPTGAMHDFYARYEQDHDEGYTCRETAMSTSVGRDERSLIHHHPEVTLRSEVRY